MDDLVNSDLSISRIALKYGRAETSIRKLMRSERVSRTRKRPSGGLKPFAKMDVLSPGHRMLGLHLIRSRGEGKKASFANALGVSAIKLGQMETGRHDFTLSEMQNIADVLGEAIFELRIVNKYELSSGSTLH